MDSTVIISGSSFFLGGILVALVVNILLLKFSRTLGIRNKNDVIVRWSNQSKPSLGGVSFFVVFFFTVIAYLLIWYDPNFIYNNEIKGFLLGSVLAFAMGLADDAYNTKPLFKLFIQIMCGVSLIAFGTVIELTADMNVNYVITVFWVVALMNSLNMLDNMDGITSTVVLFILLACLGIKFYFNIINW